MSECEALRAAVTLILDSEIGDDVVAIRAELWRALRTDNYPVIVSGPDVRNPIVVRWPRDLKPVQYQPASLFSPADVVKVREALDYAAGRGNDDALDSFDRILGGSR